MYALHRMQHVLLYLLPFITYIITVVQWYYNALYFYTQYVI